MLPVIAQLQKCSDYQVFVVTHDGPVTYRYGISQKRRLVAAWFRVGQGSVSMGYRSIPIHFQSWLLHLIDVICG